MTTSLIKYNEFIVDKCKNLTYSYKKEFQSELTPNQSIDIDNNFVFLFKTINEMAGDSTTDYEEKEYLPNIPPVVDFSYIYEFESLFREVCESESTSEELKESLYISYTIWNTLLDTWFEHKYGYFFEELEQEMYEKKMGVFAPLEGVEDA